MSHLDNTKKETRERAKEIERGTVRERERERERVC